MNLNIEMTLEEEAKLRPLLEQMAEDSLRRLRRQFRDGDKVIDRYGQTAYISHIYSDGTFELREWGTGERLWKDASEADIEEICL